VLTDAERSRLGHARAILSKAALTRDAVRLALNAVWQDDFAPMAGRAAE
jgi:hypothetical protein